MRSLGTVLFAAAIGVVVLLMLTRREAGPEPGISLQLANDRALRVSDLGYELSMRIPESPAEEVRGRLVATFHLANVATALAFDFAQPADRLISVEVNGRPLTPRVDNGHVAVPRNALVAGRNVVRFEFLAGPDALNRRDGFMYSLFVPARASLTFPCFDQPNLKARWHLTLDVPASWQAVSNGRERGRVAAGERARVVFDPTEPLPTYLFAFAAGRFQVETTQRDGRTFRIFHRETDRSKVDRNLDDVIDLHARAMEWMEGYTNIPYPFGKFDIVLLPSFQFNGMEHPGAVYYNANSILLDRTATQTQILSRANVISHETAHMWFGDFVTMTWFNDVWMKEVFANFMAAKIVNPTFPRVNHGLRFLTQHYPGAYEVDRTAGANPIRQDLANLNEAGSLYGAAIYLKAPIVMRQLERLVGEALFRESLREYLSAHAFGNASWPDLVEILDRRSPLDIAGWSDAWITEAGRPTIVTRLEVAEGRIARLSFHQQDPRGRSIVWPQQLLVAMGSPNGIRELPATLSGPDTALPDAVGLVSPDWVIPSGGGLGYGAFVLDPATLTLLDNSLHSIRDPLTRGAALVAYWESMLEGHVPASTVFDAIMRALPSESDELNLQLMLDYTRVLFWRFTRAEDRGGRAPGLEVVLQDGLARASTPTTKAAWFSALRSVAMSPATLGRLERVWARAERFPGLTLSETDETDLALDLAVRDVPNGQQILDAQLQRIANPDRRARFAFVMPALSNDVRAREVFHRGLADVGNRKQEAWVLDAMRYLHHPLRANESKALVIPALGLVREIQQTGDIFFPKRWADATLAGYQDPDTARAVQAFIESLPPDYPPRLRWVLLASADGLFRASRLLTGPTP